MRRRRSRVALPGLLALLLSAAVAGSTTAESASIAASVNVASVVLSVSLSVSPSAARVGDSVKVAATVSNSGTARAAKVSVTLRAVTGLRVKGTNPATVTQLQPGRSKSVSWNVCAVEPGNYLLLARATIDGISVDSPAVLLTVSGQRRKGC